MLRIAQVSLHHEVKSLSLQTEFYGVRLSEGRQQDNQTKGFDGNPDKEMCKKSYTKCFVNILDFIFRILFLDTSKCAMFKCFQNLF